MAWTQGRRWIELMNYLSWMGISNWQEQDQMFVQSQLPELIAWFDVNVQYITSERAKEHVLGYFKGGKTIKDSKNTYVGAEQGKIALSALYNYQREKVGGN